MPKIFLSPHFPTTTKSGHSEKTGAAVPTDFQRPRRAVRRRAGELLEQFAVSPRGRQHTDEAAAAARGVPPVSWLLGADNDDDGESWGAAASHELAPGAMLHDELIAHLTQ